MAFEDIGLVLFVEFLRMRSYPGAPFTGNTVTDLVQFFLVPTVFIVLVVYMMVGRILTPAYGKLRLLLGVTTYLFIVTGGYYEPFALIAGPYFMFLIFFMGLFYYFLSHFRGGGAPAGGGGGERHAVGGYAGERPDEGKIKHLLRLGELNPLNRNELEHELATVNATLESIDRVAASGGRVDTGELHRLQKMKKDLERRLYGHRL